MVLPIENQMTKPQVLNDDNDDDDNGDGDNDDDDDDDDYGDDDDAGNRKPDNLSSVKAVNNLPGVVYFPWVKICSFAMHFNALQ